MGHHQALLVQNLAHLQEALQVLLQEAHPGLREAHLGLHVALLVLDLEAHLVAHLVAHQ